MAEDRAANLVGVFLLVIFAYVFVQLFPPFSSLLNFVLTLAFLALIVAYAGRIFRGYD